MAHPKVIGKLSQALAVDQECIAALSIKNHEAHMPADIEKLRQSPLIPKELIVSAHLYDVTTGQMQTVVTPAPLQER